MPTNHAGELAALGTALCWASASSLFVSAGRRLGSPTLNRLRITAAAPLLGLTLWVSKGSPWPNWASGRDLEWLALSGLVGFVVGDSLYFRALVILGAGRATLLTSTAPVFTALMARFFLGETLSAPAIFGMILTLSGLLWVLQGRIQVEGGHSEGSVLAGVLCGILAGLATACGFVLSKLGLQAGLDPLSATVIRVVAAMLAMWALAPLQGGFAHPFRALRDRVATRAMLCGAFFGPFIGVVLSLYALQHTKAGIATSIMACYPIFAILLAARFHHERLTLRMASGALATVTGVLLLFFH